MSDQEKREKIIEEFERFMQEYDRDIGFTSYESEVLNGVHELLKAQEPRVMTLVELEDWDGPIYFEEIDTNEYYALIETVELAVGNKGTFVFMNVMPGEHHRRAWDGAYYNIFWRCWTSRPTDEQREAIPWMT